MRKTLVAFAAAILGVLAFTAPAQASHPASGYTPCSGPQNGVCDSDTIGLAIPYETHVGACTTFKWDSWLFQSVTASNVQADGSHDPAWTGDKALYDGSQQICFTVVGTDKYTFHYNNALTSGSLSGYSQAYTYLVHVAKNKAQSARWLARWKAAYGPGWCC